MRRWILAFSLLAASVATQATPAAECVIVLHGMGRSAQSMGKIEHRLQQRGYRVWNQPDASTSAGIPALAASAIQAGLDYCVRQHATTSHFVTHSLGGILVRAYLQNHQIPRLGRIVMLAPPNHGSEIVDVLKDFTLYDKAMGPAGQALGTSPDSLPNRLKPIPGDIGIIAGTFTSDPWFSPIIPGEDDGKVSVESAKLAEMQDYIQINSGHTFIMRNKEAIEQAIHFLQHGRLDRKP